LLVAVTVTGGSTHEPCQIVSYQTIDADQPLLPMQTICAGLPALLFPASAVLQCREMLEGRGRYHPALLEHPAQGAARLRSP
jgi:hypothetical protein